MGENRAGVGLFVGLAAAAAAALVLAAWLGPEETPPPQPAPAAFAPEPQPLPPPPEEKIRPDPAAAGEHFRRGCELYEEERYDEAQAEFELAVELDPSLHRAKFNLALVYYRCGRYVETEQLLEEVLKAGYLQGSARSLLEEVRSRHAEMRLAPGGGDL